MGVEVSVLTGFGREAALRRRARRKWMYLWKEISDRILCLPRREQDILFEDFRTAIYNRVETFEHILSKTQGGQG